VDATSFEINVAMPADARYIEVIRDLAIHAARYAGCRGADADLYGAVIEGVVRACLGREPVMGTRPVIIRRQNGPIEFLIASDLGFVEEWPNQPDPHVTVGEVTVNGRAMACVARRMPLET